MIIHSIVGLDDIFYGQTVDMASIDPNQSQPDKIPPLLFQKEDIPFSTNPREYLDRL